MCVFGNELMGYVERKGARFDSEVQKLKIP